MAQLMKVYGRINGGVLTRYKHWPLLLSWSPLATKQESGTAYSEASEELHPLFCEKYVAVLVCLGLTDVQRTGVTVEVGDA
jgi:hypothetical protein